MRSRIDWKYLLGLELEDSGFNFSVLSEFRDRILAGGQEQRLLDELLERFRGQGLLKERDKQRTDSTHIEAAVRNLNRLECVGETMRHALNSLAGVAPQWLKARAPCEWYKLYGSRFTQYRLPKTKSKRKELSIQIGQDGQQLLTWAYLPDTPEEVRQNPAVESLRQVWIQQYYQDDQVHWRETDNMPSTARVIHTPYDLEARFSQKRQTKWFGYKAHLTETCDDDQPHLITHVETTSATTQDEQVTDTIHQALETKGLVPKEHLMDRGYVNTQVLKDSQKYGIEVVGPVKVDTSWQAQSGKGFDITGFTIDWEDQVVTCPNGQLSQVWADSKDKAGRPRVYVRFPRATCRACPVRTDCTRSAKGPRTLSFKPKPEAKLFNCLDAKHGGLKYGMQVRADSRACEAFMPK